MPIMPTLPAMPEMPRGTVTFLFTNVEFTNIAASTKWSAEGWQHRQGPQEQHKQDPQQMERALYEEILRHAVEANGGYTYKKIGHAFQAAFPTAPQALRAALDAQRALHSEHWAPSQDGEPRVHMAMGTAMGMGMGMAMAMALHTGVTEVRGDDYFGPLLNRVSRLLAAAHGGQILLSLATAELVRDTLPGGASLKDLGEHRLRDLFRPERIY